MSCNVALGIVPSGNMISPVSLLVAIGVSLTTLDKAHDQLAEMCSCSIEAISQAIRHARSSCSTRGENKLVNGWDLPA